MINKHLTIVPDGNHVKGGTASYVLNPVTGHVSYALALVWNFFFTNHNYNTSGVYEIKPELLKSANTKVGETIQLGFVTITVQSIEGKLAKAHAVVQGYAEGDAVISLAGEYIDLVSINAQGSIMGVSFNLIVK